MFPGDRVYAPRGSVHAFKNHTDQTIRVLSISLLRDSNDSSPKQPSGAERDMSRIVALEEKYRTFSVKQ